MTVSTSNYLNAPVKNCRNCAHNIQDGCAGPFWDRCKRFGLRSDMAIRDICHGNGWQPKPKRRSLRLWLLDLLWT
jgi:hypothetical protein